MHSWARIYPLTDAARESQIDTGTAVDIFQWFRDICSTQLLQTPIIFWGQGGWDWRVYFVTSLRLCTHRIWCMNIMLCISYSITRVAVHNRSSGCLVWWILLSNQRWVTWKLCSRLNLVANQHTAQSITVWTLLTLPQEHTHNTYWSRAKYKIKKMKGVHTQQLPSYLDKFMRRERFGRTAHQVFASLVDDIAQLFDMLITTWFLSFS